MQNCSCGCGESGKKMAFSECPNLNDKFSRASFAHNPSLISTQKETKGNQKHLDHQMPQVPSRM